MSKEVSQFKEGNAGKPKGAVNHSTRIVKEVFADTFSELQKDKKANLHVWAKENPTEFYKLVSKLIPLQLASDPDNPIAYSRFDNMTFEELYKLKYGKFPDEKDDA